MGCGEGEEGGVPGPECLPDVVVGAAVEVEEEAGEGEHRR